MKVAVYGTGTMGAGIVQSFAQHGFSVVVLGRRETSIDRAMSGIKKNLERSVAKERMTESEMNETMGRITTTMDISDLSDVDLVIEALAENMELKQEIFKKLDEICKPSAVLATNTSSLSITEIAGATNRPDKVIGMHFFNPVPVMKAVELIQGFATSDDTLREIKEACEKISKTAVEVQEAPGFVVNRVLIPMINEAIGILAEGVATAEDIDTAMKLGASHPIGPLALADLIGNDVNLSILEVLYEEFGDQKYRPHPLLKKMVKAGKLGRKTQQGFYNYAK